MRIKLGIRSKLFLISLLVISVVILINGIYLEGRLRTWLDSHMESDLLRHARSALYVIENADSLDDIEHVTQLAADLGDVTSSRITIIRQDGSVIGDSEINPDDVPRMQNHSDRPEIIDALSGDVGISRRFSGTLNTRMLYIAVPFEREDSSGVVRVAMPVSEVDQTVGKLRGFLLIAGFIGILAAIIISFTASRIMSLRLQNLVKQAHAIVEGNKKPLLLDPSQDEISGLAGSINLIAEELERVLAELANERDQLNAVIEGMSDGVIALDAGQTITMINTTAIELLELPDSPVGRKLMDTIRIPQLIECVTNSTAKETESLEFEIHGPDLKIITITATVTPQRLGDGKVIVMRDITEVRRLETMRRDFFANASHELRTPVSIIQANAETLIAGALDDPDKAIQFLDAIHRNSQRLANLLNDLLQISTIEEGKYGLDLVPTRLHTIAVRAVDTVSTLAAGKNISIANEIDDELTVMVDERALEDILINLLDNAVKYTPENGKVILRAGIENDFVRMEVEDNGPGITPKHRDRIFERFYRIDPGRSREMGGTGLGLSIAKHLINAMDGEISYEPASPLGSIFIVTLKRV